MGSSTASEIPESKSESLNVAEVIQLIVSVRDTLAGCYECLNHCAVDHVTVKKIDNILTLLNSIK
ncbi:MAG: hypothetical protein ACW98U_12150 [Candidatus Thorarchaeota archaeon]|jgi:hypothetical protein